MYKAVKKRNYKVMNADTALAVQHDKDRFLRNRSQQTEQATSRQYR